MPIAEESIIHGVFTSAGVPRAIDLGFIPHKFRLWNETQQNSVANPSVWKEAWYLDGLAANSAYTIRNTAGAATDEHQLVAAGGFRTYSGVEEQLDAPLIGVGITNANPAVATCVSAYSVGDVVRITGSTAMLQIAGLDFVITAQTTGVSFTMGSLNAAGFAGPATAHVSRRVWTPRAFLPHNCIITNITAANPGVVTTNINHGYATGDRVRLIVPPVSGMVELNNRIVTVTALTPTTFSIGVDTTTFTAFAWPTSAQAAAGCLRPQTVPVGETGQALTDAMTNTSFQGIYLGTAVCGANADVIRWEAVRGSGL